MWLLMIMFQVVEIILNVFDPAKIIIIRVDIGTTSGSSSGSSFFFNLSHDSDDTLAFFLFLSFSISSHVSLSLGFLAWTNWRVVVTVG